MQIVGFSVLQGVRNDRNVPYLCLTLEKNALPCALRCALLLMPGGVGGLIVGVAAAAPGGGCVLASSAGRCTVWPCWHGDVVVLVVLSPPDLWMISPAECGCSGQRGGGLAVRYWVWMPPGNNGDMT